MKNSFINVLLFYLQINESIDLLIYLNKPIQILQLQQLQQLYRPISNEKQNDEWKRNV